MPYIPSSNTVEIVFLLVFFLPPLQVYIYFRVILVFFVATESDSLYLSGPCFTVQMWPVWVLQFHFEVLMFHTGGDGEGKYIVILTLNSCSILVCFVATESDSLYLSGPCFNVSMWPVLVLQFHFKVLMFHTGGDEEG